MEGWIDGGFARLTNAAEVGQRQLDAQADGALAVGRDIAGQPGDVAAGADEAGG